MECKSDQDFLHANLEWTNVLLHPYLPGFPKGFTPRSLPLAKLAVESAKNTSMAGEIPVVHDSFQLEEGEEPSEEQARKLRITEQFDKAFLTKIAMRTSNNPVSECLRKVYGLGPGILSFPWLEEVWNAREEGEDVFPWEVEVIHPLNVWPDPFHNPPLDYIIEDELPIDIANERYPKLGLGGNGTVTRLVYCSETDYAVYISDRAVFEDSEDGVVENPMGMLWYEMALAGLGETREDGDPVSLWQGIIRPLRDVIAMKITNINLREAKKFKEVLSPGQIEHPQGLDAAIASAKLFEISPLAIWPTGPGVVYRPIFAATDDQSMAKEDETLDRFIEIMMGTQVQSGTYPDKTASGLAQRVSLQQAPYEAGKVSVEQALANMLRKVRRFYKTHVGEPFSLSVMAGKRVTFNPNDLLIDCLTVVELKPTTAADRAMSLDTDLALWKAGHISGEEVRRRHNITDGTKLDKEWLEEQLFAHPKVIDASATVIAMQIMPPPAVEGQAEPPAEEPFGQPGQNGTATGALAHSIVPAGPGGF